MDLAKLGALTPESAPLGAAGLAHVSAGGDALGRGRHRCAHPSRDLAGLRQRDRPLHAAARRRARGQTFEIEVAAGTRHGPPGLHPRLRDDHAARDARRPGGAARRGSPRSRTGSPATARTSRARVPEGAQPVVGFDLTTHAGHFMGCGPQSPGAVHARGPGLGARRRHLGPDAVAPRAGLPRRRPRRPSMRSGARATSPRRACSTSSPCGSHECADARRRRQRPERAGRCHPARRGRARGDRARGRRRARRRGADRGADAARLSPRRLRGGLPRGRRLAGVRADAAGRPRPALDPSRGVLRPSAARRGGRGAVSRPRPDRREARRAAAGDGERWRAFAAPLLAGSTRSARPCSAAFRPCAAPCACSRAGPVRRGAVRAAAAGLRAGLGARLFRGAGRGPGCTDRRATATSRRPGREAPSRSPI